MKARRGKLFEGIEAPSRGEVFEPLLELAGLTIERICSAADNPPHDYVQAWDEWVVLLRGEALLRVDGEVVELCEGDWIHLPAHTPHRVERTSDGALWLAVHRR